MDLQDQEMVDSSRNENGEDDGVEDRLESMLSRIYGWGLESTLFELVIYGWKTHSNEKEEDRDGKRIILIDGWGLENSLKRGRKIGLGKHTILV